MAGPSRSAIIMTKTLKMVLARYGVAAAAWQGKIGEIPAEDGPNPADLALMENMERNLKSPAFVHSVLAVAHQQGVDFQLPSITEVEVHEAIYGGGVLLGPPAVPGTAPPPPAAAPVAGPSGLQAAPTLAVAAKRPAGSAASKFTIPKKVSKTKEESHPHPMSDMVERSDPAAVYAPGVQGNSNSLIGQTKKFQMYEKRAGKTIGDLFTRISHWGIWS